MSAAAKKTALTKTTTPATSGLPKEKLLSMYREMLTIRRFEEKAGQLYGMGLIGGFCHLVYRAGSGGDGDSGGGE